MTNQIYNSQYGFKSKHSCEQHKAQKQHKDQKKKQKKRQYDDDDDNDEDEDETYYPSQDYNDDSQEAQNTGLQSVSSKEQIEKAIHKFEGQVKEAVKPVVHM